jgi:hypothetical protein
MVLIKKVILDRGGTEDASRAWLLGFYLICILYMRVAILLYLCIDRPP